MREGKEPILPKTIVLSIVANLEGRMREGFLMPVLRSGCNSMSVGSFQPTWVVINATVTSAEATANIGAGRSFVPERSVNGNGIRTISPFFIPHYLYRSIKSVTE